MPQVARRGETAIIDRYDDGLTSIERGEDLADIGITQPRACRTARDEAAIQKVGKAMRAVITVVAHCSEMVGRAAFRLAPGEPQARSDPFDQLDNLVAEASQFSDMCLAHAN